MRFLFLKKAPTQAFSGKHCEIFRNAYVEEHCEIFRNAYVEEHCEIFRNAYVEEHLRTTAFVYSKRLSGCEIL